MNAVTRAFALAAGLAGVAAIAIAQQPDPLAGAKPAAGKPLVEKDCIECHTRSFGDADTIYTRADRRVHTRAQLLAQVAFCNVNLKTGYFPEEEADVAAYLNQRYYKFAK